MQKQILATVFALGLAVAPLTTFALEGSSVVLDVHHAGCVLCGPIIKSTLKDVPGVNSVSVSQPDGVSDVTATIDYDPEKTTPAELIKIVVNRGYPAKVME